MGYYLPDEDFGAEQSVFVDFFATYKATLPGLNKMAKLAKAVVIPMFPRYNAKNGKYEMEIRPPMQLSDDPEQSARAMNEEIEYFRLRQHLNNMSGFYSFFVLEKTGKIFTQINSFYLQKCGQNSPHFCIFIC